MALALVANFLEKILMLQLNFFSYCQKIQIKLDFQKPLLLGFLVGSFDVQNLIFAFWDMGSCYSWVCVEEGEQFSKKTSTATDVRTWDRFESTCSLPCSLVFGHALIKCPDVLLSLKLMSGYGGHSDMMEIRELMFSIMFTHVRACLGQRVHN
jgi:hypothetical protein